MHLVNFLLASAKIGLPRKQKEVIAMAETFLQMNEHEGNLSSGWWTRFRKRHPEITVKKAESLSK
eukprot:m.22111 g.22111  ORF g.22111 m.22111 type:complete len:65 (+) comp28285_c0_seq1:394-588(+)